MGHLSYHGLGREVQAAVQRWFRSQEADTMTINAVRYIQTVLKLRRALREKRPGKKIVLQHDNAWPHTDRVTVKKIRTFGWEILPQATYSPDLAPSDYHLFGSVKEQCVSVFGKIKRTSTAREFSNLQNDGKNVCKEMETVLKSDRKVCRLRHEHHSVLFPFHHHFIAFRDRRLETREEGGGVDLGTSGVVCSKAVYSANLNVVNWCGLGVRLAGRSLYRRPPEAAGNVVFSDIGWLLQWHPRRTYSEEEFGLGPTRGPWRNLPKQEWYMILSAVGTGR
ncbi:hypothetical protein ANN_21307 [Periplaneta americana]|uniref:Histone-lysine N-methyltransferase SETMAR n=1 Tax=Periplaneta americana TaxID=6978 RepID=A0ABQ8SEY7_PERAM|nr:hypothetical protein ANN_21307 [Periplaneta americana]